MSFKEFLKENSLYSDATSKAALASDKERLMDSLMFNFFGFLGLYNLSDSRGFMRTYETTEGNLIISQIDDTNHDVSLSVKMAYDAGLITQTVVNKMTRLLTLIKQRKLKGKDLDSSMIRAFLDEIHYTTHRPSTKVFSIIQKFHDGTLDLPNLAKELYQLAKMREYTAITSEFRGLVIKGQYNDFFSKLKSSNGATTSVTSNNVQTAQTIAAPKSLVPPPQIATNLGQVDEFMDAIFEAKDQSQFDDAFKTYGVSKTEFDFNKFETWISTKKDNKNLSSDLMKRPLFKWLKRVLPGRGRNEAYRIMNLLLSEYIKRFADARDIKGFLASIKDFNLGEVRDIFSDGGSRFLKVYNESLSTLVNLFASDIIAHVSDYSDATLEQLRGQFDLLRNFSSKVGVPAEVSDKKIWGEKFGKIGAFVVALGAYPPNTFKTSPSLSSNQQIYIKDWFEKTFGTDSMINPESGNFKIKQESFNEAPIEIQLAFEMLVRNKIKGAEVVDILNAGKIWARHWTTKLINNAHITGQLNDFNQIDVTKLTNSDIETAYQVIIALPDISRPVSIFRLVSAKGLNNVGKAYFENALKVIMKMVKAGKINDLNSLLLYAMKSRFAFDQVTKWLESSSIIDRVESTLNSIRSSNDVIDDDLEKELFKWYIKLVKSGKQTIGKELIIKIYRRYQDIDYVMPTDSKDIDGILQNLQFNFKSLDYIHWMVSQDADLRARIIEFNETLDVTKTHGSISSGYSIKYPVRFLKDEYITDAIIDNFKKQWLRVPAEELDDIGMYSFSEKLTKAYREMLESVLDTPGHEDLVFRSLAVSAPDKINAFLDKMSASQMIDLLANQKTPVNDVVQFIESMKNNSALVKSLSTSAIAKFSQALSESFEKNKTKFEKSYRDNATKDFMEFLGMMLEANREDDLEVIYSDLKGDLKKSMIKYFSGYEFIRAAAKKIFDDENLIKPFEQLNHERLIEILRYNNVDLPVSNVRNSPTFKSLLNKSSQTNAIPNLNVELVEHKSPEDLERRSVEYDVFNKYRHGNIAIRFIREFNVDIPQQRAGQEEFLKQMPDTDRIDPAFHGTGSVAASMILRYGFAVIKSSDSSVVGRMLGDGVYFSTVLDKVGQYVSDGGFTRGIGTRGYVFQMSALLGRENIDFRAAGLGGDNIRSPEWVVFQPNKQLRIYKAFEVEIIPKSEMNTLKSKYNINEETAVKIISFKEFLREAQTLGKQTTTYTFVDGMIPVTEDKMVDFEEFKPEQFGPHVRLEPSQNGPMVIIEHDGEESEAYLVRFTASFMKQKDDLQKFLRLLNGNS